MEQRFHRYGRRRVLGAIGVGTALGLAGCLGDDSTDDDSNGGEESNEGADGTDETSDGESDSSDSGADDDTDDTASVEEAVAFPEGRDCTVCNMVAADHPDWNAQLVHEDGHREFFCSTGCLAAYYAVPETFDGPETEIAGVWVTDYESGDLVDASEASFVRVSDPDHVDDVMTRNPTPFADRDDAESFVAEFDAYDEDDIIELSAFDRDLAEYYRGNILEGNDGGDTEHGH
ncbi:Nitrous oxide reductase accessory protein NosL [Halobiforma haloterrestris]|uniref:Nitrous oxide reductase accessory protein NosL n=1 Tax=Natronobacterium haloterrestre TaxID=148448 RepID=A0A1I1IAW7_NATHA|nr:nitrous oxide reductase accessory protein NosL [Halobiforma haloterrestris]SFC33205.1 Nitrous oxide reductase accessory protein NosL [Halobiforma haloterrestris]